MNKERVLLICNILLIAFLLVVLSLAQTYLAAQGVHPVPWM